MTDLFTAIENDDSEGLQKGLAALKDKKSFFQSRNQGFTPVQWAIKMFFKDLSTIKQLLDLAKAEGLIKSVVEGDIIQATDWSNGMCALEYAIKLQGTQRTQQRRDLTKTIQDYLK